MDTPDEIARDEWYSEVFSEAVEEFTSERLRSYYLAHPSLAVPAFEMYSEAMAVRQGISGTLREAYKRDWRAEFSLRVLPCARG